MALRRAPARAETLEHPSRREGDPARASLHGAAPRRAPNAAQGAAMSRALVTVLAQAYSDPIRGLAPLQRAG
jgi:hypothetical protein